MFDNTLLFKSLESQIQKMITEIDLIIKLTQHSGEKGRENEGVLREFLKNMLPSKWEITTGFIVDHIATSKASGQTDIIIYNPSEVPVVFKGYHNSIVPVHSVGCTIEVKTKLNNYNQLMKECLLPANRIKETYKAVVSALEPDQEKGIAPYCILFCYSSGMSLETIAKGLNERVYKGTSLEPDLDLVVVLDRGIVFKNKTNYHDYHFSNLPNLGRAKVVTKPDPEGRPWVFNEFYGDLLEILVNHKSAFYQTQRWTL